MERQNCLIVIHSIIYGIYFITLGASRCIFNAFYMKWGCKAYYFRFKHHYIRCFFHYIRFKHHIWCFLHYIRCFFHDWFIIGLYCLYSVRLSSWSSPVSHVAVEFAGRLEKARKAHYAILTLRLTFSDIGPIQINWLLKTRTMHVKKFAKKAGCLRF